MYTLLDGRGSILTTVCVTGGRTHEVNWLDRLVFEANGIYIMDRGYLDFACLHTIEAAQVFFVIPAKERLNYHRLHSRPVVTTTGLRSDQTISLTGFLFGQVLSGQITQRGANAIVDRGERLHAGGHPPKATQNRNRSEHVHDSPNPGRQRIRQNPLPQLLANVELQTVTDDSHNQLLLFNQYRTLVVSYLFVLPLSKFAHFRQRLRTASRPGSQRALGGTRPANRRSRSTSPLAARGDRARSVWWRLRRAVFIRDHS